MTHDGVPPPLADPPWRRRLREHEAAVAARRRARGGVPRVDGLEAPGERLIVWAPGERRTWLAPFERPAAVDGGWEEAVRRYVDGELTDARSQAAVFGLAPEELVRPLLPDWRPTLTEETGKALAARFGTDVHHIVFANAKAKPYRLGPVLMPFRDVEVARLMADWFHRLKSARDIAREWLLRHGAEAAALLVPDALGERRTRRDRAVAALRMLAGELGNGPVIEAARRYGNEAADAVARVLGETPPEDPAPLERPAQPPRLPWLDVAALPELRLRGGFVLPPEAVENVVGGLSLSYGGLWDSPAMLPDGFAEVLELCEPRSLAEFGWALFDAWVEARTPPRSGWVIDQFIWTADDATVERLGAALLRWPGAGGTDKHAVGVLGWIATDAALRQLRHVHRHARQPGRRDAAADRLAHAARSRGLALPPEES